MKFTLVIEFDADTTYDSDDVDQYKTSYTATISNIPTIGDKTSLTISS